MAVQLLVVPLIRRWARQEFRRIIIRYFFRQHILKQQRKLLNAEMNAMSAMFSSLGKSFDIKIEGLDKLYNTFDPRLLNEAKVAAINRITQMARTEISRKIRQKYNIAAARISQNLIITRKASFQSPEGEITGRQRGMPLSYFSPKQSGVIANKKSFRYTRRAKGGRGGAVSVEVKRGGRKTVSGEPKPFLTRFRSGHIAVAARQGKDRLPIEELLGPGVALLMGTDEMKKVIDDLIRTRFKDIFFRELHYRMNRNRR